MNNKKGGLELIKTLKYKKIKYVLRVPENFSENVKYPLIIYLHGAGGRGDDINIIRNHVFFNETADYLKNAVSIAPQCYENSWFTIFEQLQDFIEYVVNMDYIDKEKVYLVGASMGGYATWQMAMSRPEFFAAIIPICGGGMYWNALRLVNMGVWAFHGEKDATVFLEESEKMVKNINDNGGNSKLTIYQNCGHNAWEPTFNNKRVWKWLLTQTNNGYKDNNSSFSDVEKFG